MGSKRILLIIIPLNLCIHLIRTVWNDFWQYQLENDLVIYKKQAAFLKIRQNLRIPPGFFCYHPKFGVIYACASEKIVFHALGGLGEVCKGTPSGRPTIQVKVFFVVFFFCKKIVA